MHSCHAIGCRPLTKPAHPRQLIRPARKKPAGQTGGPRLVKRESTSIHGAAGWALSRGDTIRDRARGASKWGFWSKKYGETRGTTPRPPTALDMRLGEASGAGVAILLLRAALACHARMATFAEAGVSGPGK